MLSWNKFPIKEVELSLAKVLRCGQTFRWKNINNVWSFSLDDKVIFLKQDEYSIHYSWIMKEGVSSKDRFDTSSDVLGFVRDYFNLNVNLELLYQDWSHRSSLVKAATHGSAFQRFTGIRILRQDPWETLVSFICSSNNNVKRISKMCDSLCTEFGTYIATHGGVDYYSFPTAQALSSLPSVETKLRELGFGYRAKYIYQTALMLTDPDNPDLSLAKLYDLRLESYEACSEFLIQLSGVGPKVADCVCLMALDKHDVVPVDTHVYQIAIRDYKYKGKRDLKTMNKKVYEDIRTFFKNIFGPYAGWAQSVLFTSDLSDLNNGINETTVSVKQEVKETSDMKLDLKEEIKVEQKGGKKRTTKVMREIQNVPIAGFKDVHASHVESAEDTKSFAEAYKRQKVSS